MACKRRNMFYENKKQEATEIEACRHRTTLIALRQRNQQVEALNFSTLVSFHRVDCLWPLGHPGQHPGFVSSGNGLEERTRDSRGTSSRKPCSLSWNVPRQTKVADSSYTTKTTGPMTGMYITDIEFRDNVSGPTEHERGVMRWSARGCWWGGCCTKLVCVVWLLALGTGAYELQQHSHQQQQQIQRLPDRTRSIRGFKNVALSTARGFGKRTGQPPRPDYTDKMENSPDRFRLITTSKFKSTVALPLNELRAKDDKPRLPADWFAQEMSTNGDLARLVVDRFLDRDGDGSLTAAELLGPLLQPSSSSSPSSESSTSDSGRSSDRQHSLDTQDPSYYYY
ncbi:hypothetical protein AAG570_013753 [Ranatra chinensis]|uniref:Allatotropin n=1 Tax=Ranatra chinensis TaxID=642074 RepID=A0ABD0Z1C5_9HEMI